jgi:NAD-dependent dihydropyrimidine dehydrogenase PreA subunit
MTLWLPHIDLQRCLGSGDCISSCPTQALDLVDGRAAIVRPDACTYCGSCEWVCPQRAISLAYLIRKEIQTPK